MNKEISYISCIKCKEEWVFEEEGICEKCIIEVENDIAILSLLNSTKKVTAFSKDQVDKYRKQITNVIDRLQSTLGDC